MTKVNRRLYALALLSLASTAAAHAGAGGTGFAAGLLHPVSGLDHLLTMVAVGILAVPFGWRGLWVPAAFVSALILGGLSGIAGLHLPFVEQGIALSVAVLGLLLAFAGRLPLAALIVVCAIMGLLHGHAHGSELPETALALTFFAGFTLTTGALHLAGFGLGWLGSRAGVWLRRVVGTGVAVAGAWLLFG